MGALVAIAAVVLVASRRAAAPPPPPPPAFKEPAKPGSTFEESKLDDYMKACGSGAGIGAAIGGPVGAAAGCAVGAGAYGVYDNWEDIKDGASDAWDEVTGWFK